MKRTVYMPANGEMQELSLVTVSDRRKMGLSRALNRFWRKMGDNRELARVGPGVCKHCGKEPCGGGWGAVFSKESARCCEKCEHAPLAVGAKGQPWQPTHIIWYCKKAFFVAEHPIGKGGAVYYRQDGVAWFVRDGMQHLFLGRPIGSAEFARFAITDENGWPAGMTAEDVGLGRRKRRPARTLDDGAEPGEAEEGAQDDEGDEGEDEGDGAEDDDGEDESEDGWDDDDDETEGDEDDGEAVDEE